MMTHYGTSATIKQFAYLWRLGTAVLDNLCISNRTWIVLRIMKHIIKMELLSVCDEEVAYMRRGLVTNHFSNSSKISAILPYTYTGMTHIDTFPLT